MADSVVPKSVTWGLFAAWLANDLEELITMPGWARRTRPRLEKRFPAVPGRVWDRLDVSRGHAAVAIGLMGGVVAHAARAGARSGGRDGFYQAALAGFGWHGVVHVAQAALVRGYTPGVATSPTVVIPFSLWAWRRLRKAGVAGDGRTRSLGGIALFPVVLAGVHGVAAILSARRATIGA
ncbi:HXXEE domain-containing protein [Amycolatopsis anabasis]|uniref:HXXEE domain-containing protein n=1 Tax=Amycolatopsis anabasis TaxID=1840409 RepID=UPI001FE94E76|nr:HXXEE domain-containing protein [Amycolatopsis anabasis]